MTHTLSRRELLARISASAWLAASGCAGRPATTGQLVHIATAAGSTNMTLSELMRQQGFLESFGLAPDVIPMSDGTKILGGIFSGSIDLSPISGFGQVFPAIERGADLKIINAATLVPWQAMFTAKDNVRSLRDLEGKVVGVGGIGALVHQMTVTLLRKHGVDVNAVKFVNIGSVSDIFKGVMEGTVDAGTGPASFVDDAQAFKVRAIPNGNMTTELKEFTYQAGWTSVRMITDKRDLLVRVLAAYAKLFAFVHQASSRDAFLKARTTVFPDAPEHEHLAEWAFLQAYKPFAPDLVLSPERVRYMQQINVDFEIQKEILPYERVADMSLAHEAIALANKV